MSKWLARLREHEKNRQMQENRTDKIDRMPSEAISSILSARSGRESANFSRPSSPANDDAAAQFEERAAILEYDEGLSRDEAEHLARVQTLTSTKVRLPSHSLNMSAVAKLG